MDAELKLTNMMYAAAGRYTELRAAFKRFRTAARDAYASHVRYGPLGVIIGDLGSKQRFSAEFSGRIIWFVLSLRLDDSETAIGQVTCLLQRADGEVGTVALGRFNLGKQGETSLDAPDRLGEKLNVFEVAGAGYVVLHCLRLALKKDHE